MNISGDLNLLVALQALLEERNVTKAGVRIGMGQPAMSGALGRLRRHFDDDLLLRVGRQYELTPLAQRVLPLVQSAVELAERTLKVSSDFDPHSSGRTFTLTVSDSAMISVVDGLIKRVRDLGLAVQLDVEIVPADVDDDAVQMLLLRRDLVVLPLGYAVQGRSASLYRDSYVCIGDRDNPRLADGEVSLQTLADLPHATSNLDRGMLSPPYRRLSELGVQWTEPVSVASALLLPMVIGGTDLVAMIPQRLARRYGRDPRTAVFDLPFEVDLTELMHWHPSRDRDVGHGWLRTQLRQVAAELMDRGDDRPSIGGLPADVSPIARPVRSARSATTTVIAVGTR